MKRTLRRLFSSLLTFAIVVTMLIQAVPTANAAFEENDGKFYAECNSYDDAIKMAQEVAIQVAAEGNVLLKNKNNALPLNSGTLGESVSIFGISSDSTPYANEKTVKLSAALRDAGVRVNPVLEEYYDKNEESFKTRVETTQFSKKVESSFGNYNDVAIVFWSVGAGGEGYGDGATNTGEPQAEDETWHQNAVESEGVSYKHELQMNDSEIRLLEYVKAQGFKKIVYIVSSWTPVEISRLENEDAVDAILWISTPSETGNIGTAQILTGQVNPSGKTPDIWYRDFTADPTWFNLGSGSQHGRGNLTEYTDKYGNSINAYQSLLIGQDGNEGYYGGESAMLGKKVTALDYEEDIYVGYHFYETAAAVNNYEGFDYNDAVVYPFGYGLSYTSFEYSGMKATFNSGDTVSGNFNADELQSPYEDDAEKDTSAMETAFNSDDTAAGIFSADEFQSSVEGGAAKISSATVQVTVTNTGSVAGKEVVQIYAQAPYSGKLEKSHVVLVGFAKTELLQPGESQTLEISVNMQDMASYDEFGVVTGKTGYVLESGRYTLYAIDDSHGWASADTTKKQSVDFVISGDANLELDDYSGNRIENLFSVENGHNNTTRGAQGALIQINENPDAKMERLSRNDFAGTMPHAPTADDLVLSDQAIAAYCAWMIYDADFQNGILGEDGKFTYQYAKATGKDAIEKVEVTALRNTTDAGDYVYIDFNEDGQMSADEVIMDVEADMGWLNGFRVAMEAYGITSAEEYDRIREYWTQSETETTNHFVVNDNGVEHTVLLADLSGINPDSRDVIEDGLFAGMTGREVWDEFLNQYTLDEIIRVVSIEQKTDQKDKGKYALAGGDNCHNWNSTFQWSCNGGLAATWNAELSYRQGVALGNIIRFRGGNTWWGTGAQVHRHYFAGRNHEYFAEDPILAGFMAAAEIEGCHVNGINTMIKHMALNDEETNRGNNVCGYISEQAFRERYLKPFQICLQEGNATSIMTAFARLGMVSTAASYNMFTRLVKEQWGAIHTSITTDIWIGAKSYGSVSSYLYAGLDNFESPENIPGVWSSELQALNYGDGTAADYFQWYELRKAMETYLFLHANTALNHNGVYFYDWNVQDATFSQGEKTYTTKIVEVTKPSRRPGGEPTVEEQEVIDRYLASAHYSALDDAGYTVEYSIAAGALPDGIILTEGGNFEGIPTAVGEYEVTVQIAADKVITDTRTMKFTIEPSFFVEAGSEIYVGEEASVLIEADPAVIEETQFAASILQGELPEGLVLDPSGVIMGTAEKSGDYPLLLQINTLDVSGTVTGSYSVPVVVTVNDVPSESVTENESLSGRSIAILAVAVIAVAAVAFLFVKNRKKNG